MLGDRVRRDAGDGTVHLRGTVTSVGGGSIGLRVDKGGKNAASLVGSTVTIAVDSGTRITVGKAAGGLADITVGARAAVAAKGFPNALVATRLHAGKAAATRYFAGAVVAVGSASLAVTVDRTGRHDTELMGRTITVSVAAGTPIGLGKDRTPIPLSAIQVGYRARLSAKPDASGSWTAVRVHVGLGNHWFGGQVVAAGSSSLTVAVKKSGPHDRQLRGQTLTVPVDSSTQYSQGKDKKPIALADVKAGDRVGVLVHSPGGHLSKGITAVRVHDWPKK